VYNTSLDGLTVIVTKRLDRTIMPPTSSTVPVTSHSVIVTRRPWRHTTVVWTTRSEWGSNVCRVCRRRHATIGRRRL